MSKPTFDQSKAYVTQEDDVYFDDGREIELLHFIYSKTNIDEIRGSPEKVIQAIDEYGRTKKYLMTVGEDKGKIVTDLIREVKPKIMVRTLVLQRKTRSFLVCFGLHPGLRCRKANTRSG